MQQSSFSEEAIAQKGIQRIATWGKVMGIIMMIGGALSAIGGLFYFIVGAIPGALSVFLGWLVYKTGDAATAIRRSGDTRALGDLLHNYGLYLFISFIMLVVTVVGSLLLFMILGVFIFSSFNNGF
ncbi:DUF5362 family protein [Edaphobacillus lindanitolerans]|uniref:DUF5362 domain-containing protein n=1 Tax=Edaphobacillus lindanitolerans TaxID=550447 RepID=A0A1U7PI69_9BACI|nr:DUF5362 family protein [Edaphobacillus lindanitolerans]SIT71942.1 hypothetical protein SAMN05428946_0800 [Edaphobacillus lindanitolerans]